MLLRIAIRNLIRRGRKNAVVAILIAVGVCAFFTANAVLESSIGGIQRTFSNNFTADLSVSERSEQSFSLFGPDVPVIGVYESAPVIINAADVGSRISSTPGVTGMAYVLSSPVLLEAGTIRDPALGLGVIGDEYFSLFRGPKFIAGAPPAPGSRGWAVITEEWARKISSAQGRPAAPGDTIQLSFFRNQSFAIREAKLAGIIRYQPSNDALKTVVIMDARILRALCGYSQVSGQEPALAASSGPRPGSSGEVDSLFSATPAPASPGNGSSQAPVSVTELQKLMSAASQAGAREEVIPLGHDGAWHFILVRTGPGADKSRLASAIRRNLPEVGYAVQVRDWRGTAGAVALYVYFMQIVLYVGFVMLGGIVLILTINSLVMSVFERVSEIGTMRAIGAQKGFVRGLFIVETGALTLVAGAAGVVLGSIIVLALNRVPLHFTNQILILLFGGTWLQPEVSGINVIVSLVASIVLGAIAWAYPVKLALQIQPVRAIHAA